MYRDCEFYVVHVLQTDWRYVFFSPSLSLSPWIHSSFNFRKRSSVPNSWIHCFVRFYCCYWWWHQSAESLKGAVDKIENGSDGNDSRKKEREREKKWQFSRKHRRMLKGRSVLVCWWSYQKRRMKRRDNCPLSGMSIRSIDSQLFLGCTSELSIDNVPLPLFCWSLCLLRIFTAIIAEVFFLTWYFRLSAGNEMYKWSEIWHLILLPEHYSWKWLITWS